VAIMCYTGYNVEDAILINQGALDRGLFRTTYYSLYESKEDVSVADEVTTRTTFSDFKLGNVTTAPGYDYSYLDKNGVVIENTEINDKIVMIGAIKTTTGSDEISNESVFTKKGQLGRVDKTFITEDENGIRLAKIRVREERIPGIGDKMASRAGQKGTIGLIIPEKDMPYAEDGTRPDIIINPHAIPSRMTIGQLIETMFGKACLANGTFGDCTAFSTNGPNNELYGQLLTDAGFHSSGNQVLYNGMNGEQIESNIFIGPTYYMRLKHMVKDKINYRSNDGPNTMMTRQPVQGRANDGGLRIGEMERDAIMSHGMTSFLSDSFLKRADEYYMAVCNKTGMIAVYNPESDIFFSPAIDGPGKFGEMNGEPIRQISRFGRSFSLVRVPYSFKLLIQELQVINVQMRIITDENVDQIMNMTQSDNINKLLDLPTKTTEEFKLLTTAYSKVRYKKQVDKLIAQQVKEKMDELVGEIAVAPVKEPRVRERALEKEADEEKEKEEGEKGEEKPLVQTLPSWIPQPNIAAVVGIQQEWGSPLADVQDWEFGAPMPPQDNGSPKNWAYEEKSPGYADNQSPDYASNPASSIVQSQSEVQPLLPTTPPEGPPPPPLPSGWVKYMSKKNIPYYFNEKNGKSVWNVADIPLETQTILTEVEEEPTEEEKKDVETTNETKKINM
jgi:DNA-directed RNA polymerase II subunit RPB2